MVDFGTGFIVLIPICSLNPIGTASARAKPMFLVYIALRILIVGPVKFIGYFLPSCVCIDTVLY